MEITRKTFKGFRFDNAAWNLAKRIAETPVGFAAQAFGSHQHIAAEEMLAAGLIVKARNGFVFADGVTIQEDILKAWGIEEAERGRFLAPEEVLATAEAAVCYREPVAAFVAPVPVAKPVGFASGKLGPVFQYRAPNLRAGARCRFEARNGFEGVGYITGIVGDAVTIRYRNAQGEQAIEDVPAYRVWPYGGIPRGEQKTTWGAREKEIRNRAFEKGSDD